MMKIVYPIEERCMNCHLCEVACTVAHSSTRDPVAAFRVEGLRFNWEFSAGVVEPAEALKLGRPKPLARCRVEAQGATSLSIQCRHCEEADCLLACKNGALYRDAEGRVLLDEGRCVGCWMCIMACRYGVISRNPSVGNVAGVQYNGINHHCDLCVGRAQPACVQICPTQALIYAERDGAKGNGESCIT